MSHRLRFVMAQLGRKPGGRDLLARLLSADDLPDGMWRRVDQRTWRTGVSATPWGDRARETGSVTAWRSFRDLAGRRWLWLQVMPLASAQDARTALDEAGDLQLRNLRATVRVVDESDVDIEPFAGASMVWAHEYRTVGPGGPGATLMLAGAVDSFVVIVCASGQPAWDWPSVSDLAAMQARRLAPRVTGVASGLGAVTVAGLARRGAMSGSGLRRRSPRTRGFSRVLGQPPQ